MLPGRVGMPRALRHAVTPLARATTLLACDVTRLPATSARRSQNSRARLGRCLPQPAHASVDSRTCLGRRKSCNAMPDPTLHSQALSIDANTPPLATIPLQLHMCYGDETHEEEAAKRRGAKQSTLNQETFWVRFGAKTFPDSESMFKMSLATHFAPQQRGAPQVTMPPRASP